MKEELQDFLLLTAAGVVLGLAIYWLIVVI